jgi:hypothetical protein
MLKKIVYSQLLIPVTREECFDDTCSVKPHGFQLKYESKPDQGENVRTCMVYLCRERCHTYPPNCLLLFWCHTDSMRHLILVRLL